MNRIIRRFGFFGGALALLLSRPQAEAWAAGRQQLYGHVPKAVATAPRIGALDPTTELNLTLSLPLRNNAELQELLKQLYDPRSSQYRHFLTPDQFEARFGPSEADYQALLSFAQSNHLTIDGTRSSRRLLKVSGTVGNIQKVFHVSLNQYQRPNGSLFFAPENEPSVDFDVPVLHVGGLDNYQVPKPMLHASAPQAWVPHESSYRPSRGGISPKATANAGSAPSSLYWGSDFRNAYVPGVCLTGTGQSVALVEFEGYYDSDILGYETLAGLSNVPVTNILIDGFNGVPPRHNADSNGVIEVSLDIEMAISMAPGLSQVRVYEVSSTAPANDADDMLDQIATDGKTTPINQISCSWTGFGDTTSETYFEQFAAQGQAFFQAAGDDGAYVTGDPDTTVPSPINFSSNIEMTVVGGTELTMNGLGQSYLSETTWNAPLGGVTYAGGGGVCSVVPIPAYQQGASMTASLTANGGSTIFRNIPDVSMVADNIFVVANKSYTSPTNYSYYTVVGTSCATPLWAGFLALANQQGAGRGVTVGFANPALFAIGLGGNYTSDFNDINDGSNNNLDGNPNLYKAVTGYDLATGWGTPMGQNLINALTGLPAFACTPTPTVTLAATQTPTRTLTRTPTNTLTNTPTQTMTNTAMNTSTPSPTQTRTNTSIPTATFTPSGTPTHSQTTTPTVTPSNTSTNTPLPTSTATMTSTPSGTATNTQTNTASSTSTLSPTDTSFNTATSTASETPTPTPTDTSTALPTATPTDTFTNTPLPTLTGTMTSTPSGTATNTQTSTASSTSTFSPTDTPFNTATSTASETPTPTPTDTSTALPTATHTDTFTDTPLSTSTGTMTSTPSGTATNTQTSTASSTSTLSPTDTPFNTATSTVSETPTPIPTATSTATPSGTPSDTSTNTPLPTSTGTMTSTPSGTATNTQTSTASSTPTFSPTDTPFNTATSTVSETPTPIPTATSTATPSGTPSDTSTNTPLPTLTGTMTSTPSGTATNTQTSTASSTSTFSPTDTPFNMATSTASETPTPTPIDTSAALPTATPTDTFTDTPLPTSTGTMASTLSNTATNTQTNTPTPTPTGTCSATTTFTITFTPVISITETATASSTPMAGETSTPTPTPSAVSLPGEPTPGCWVRPNLSRGGEPIDWQVVLTSPSAISFSLYDVAGELVYKTSVQGNAGSNTISWTLQNQSGQKVARGLYIYYIEISQGFPLRNPYGKVLVLY